MGSPFVNHTGKTKIANNGMQMTIIAYRSNSSVDIQFEDGVIVYNKRYQAFKSGYIGHPDINRQSQSRKERITGIRIGEKSELKNGETIKIIAYQNNHNIDVEFEDGSIRQHVTYQNFKDGCVSKNKVILHDISRIGETTRNNQNLIMKIKAYRSSVDIDVEFEDGSIVKNKRYSDFQERKIPHPHSEHSTYRKKANYRIGETSHSKENILMTIIEYEDANNITIKYEDGNIRKNMKYDYFKRKVIGYPKRYKTLKIGKLAYHAKGKWAFYVKCTCCGLRDVMTYEQMQKHVCDDNLNLGGISCL